MEHVRTSALQRVVADLTGIPGIKSVRPARRFPYSPDQLPAISCHWLSEQGKTTEAGVPGRRMQTRDMTLRVCIVTAVAALPDDDPPEYELDGYQAEVEARLAADTRLADPGQQALARDVRWVRTDTGEANQGALAVTVTALQFTVVTHHREGDPTNPMPR